MQIEKKTARAQASGALQPIATTVETVIDHNVPFQIYVGHELARKPKSGVIPVAGAKNPFLPPYEDDLYVGSIPPSHECLINKFPVLPAHALVVTREFEPQTDSLTRADCEALAYCLAEGDALAFYNCGAEAGASQPHKHMQLVRMSTQLPMVRAFEQGRLPFLSYFARLQPTADEIFHHLSVGLRKVLSGSNSAFNLIAARDWLALIGRGAECFEDISVNALGFAGTFFVRSPAQLGRLISVGPTEVLRQVAFSTSATRFG